MQNVRTRPSSVTTTWLCSQVMCGNSVFTIRFDREATGGISSMDTVNVRSIRYRGMSRRYASLQIVSTCKDSRARKWARWPHPSAPRLTRRRAGARAIRRPARRGVERRRSSAPRRLTIDDSGELVQRLRDEPAEVAILVLVDPALERGPEDGRAGVGGQAGGKGLDAPAAQGFSHVRGEHRVLDLLPLLEARVGGDDGLAPTGQVAPLVEDGAGRVEGGRVRLHRGHRRGRVGERAHEDAVHLAREDDLALVGEVAVERPLREPGPLGDLRHRGPVEAVLSVELEGR